MPSSSCSSNSLSDASVSSLPPPAATPTRTPLPPPTRHHEPRPAEQSRMRGEPRNPGNPNANGKRMVQLFQASRNGAQNLRAVLTQRQCVTASPVVESDPIAGSCANCFYNGRSGQCSVRAPTRDLEKPTRPSKCAREEAAETTDSEYERQPLHGLIAATVKVLESSLVLQAIPSELLLQCGLMTKGMRPGPAWAGVRASQLKRMRLGMRAMERSIEQWSVRFVDHTELVKKLLQVVREQVSQPSDSEDD
ncbi:uncharacterized protein PG986_003936 [Apiospora aurea]|uniref:Uncharacterized protein n=1 Tax=Apiospora aurea TaxID=335848 RepID=A0ABR1QLL9_9PEZI